MKMYYVFIVSVLLFVGCSEQATQPDEPTPVRQLTAGERRISTSTAAFGWALFSEMAAANPDANIVLSPLSASLALSMTMNGAEGETWSQMRDALRHEATDHNSINDGYRGLMDVLRSMDPRVTTTIANSIWIRQGFTVAPIFLTELKNSYDADARELDFEKSDAADIINDWVKTHTGGKIPSIIEPPINPDMVMYLINAVYFKGKWKYGFDANNTRNDQFTDINGNKRNVRMMSGKAKVLFTANDSYVAADIPYGWDRYRMAIIVPRNPDALRQLEHSFVEPGAGAAILANMSETEIDIQLPRFTLEDDHIFNKTLINMGMARAFDPYKAEFFRINPTGGLYINNVRQKTFITVDEDGTEAAAATSVEVGIVSMPPTLRADRPFIFIIHEVNTDAILFIGRVADISS